MSNTRDKRLAALGRVIDTLDILRVRCPWDAKQTNESLRPNTIEEVYELAQALANDDTADIKKELGDVLLHVLFYSKIADEQGRFDIADVADALNDKLIFRHPHIFGDVKVGNAHDVETNWEKIKLKEKGGNRTVLAGVPEALPALIKAFRIQEKPQMSVLTGKSATTFGKKSAKRPGKCQKLSRLALRAISRSSSAICCSA